MTAGHRTTPRTFARALARGAALAAALVAASGCSGLRARTSERQGLLQRLDHDARTNRAGDGIDDLRASIHVRKHAGPAAKTAPARDPAAQDVELAQARKVGLRWPVRDVHITSSFGKRSRGFHEGVDLKASVGTPVFAAQSGVVLYADRRIRGYGRMIILRHDGGLSTVYAHNSRLLVRRGQRVKFGQKIAISGRSGHVSGPHVHFEVRKGINVVDPEQVIGGTRSPMAKLEFVDDEEVVAKADVSAPVVAAAAAPAPAKVEKAALTEDLVSELPLPTAPAPIVGALQGAPAARLGTVAARTRIE